MGANSIGLWIRRRPRQVSSVGAWAERIADYGVDVATLVLNVGTQPTHLSTWNLEVLVMAISALRRRGIEPWLMCWPHARRQDVDALIEDCARILAACREDGVKAPGIEVDAEGRHNSTGWGPAGAQFAPRLAAGLKAVGFERAAITAIPPRRGLRPQDLALLESLCAEFGGDKVEARPQAYSKDDPRKSWDDSGFFRPGVIQRATFDTWQPHCTRLGCALVMGGMLGFQNHPPGFPDGLEALRVAFDSAHALGVRRFHYWVDNVQDKAGPAFLREAGNRTPDKGEGGSHTHQPPRGPGKDAVRLLQRRLADLGYEPGPVDGIVGARTRHALEVWRQDTQGVEAAALAAGVKVER